MLRKLIVFCFLIISGFTFSQVGIGQWRSLNSGHQGELITQSNSRIFVSLGNSLLIYDKETSEIQNWNSVNALTDINITAIQYDQADGILYVGYQNGNIDMIKGNTVYNLPAIRLSNIIGLKSIQRFVFRNGLTYVCTGFGVVVIYPDKYEVKETYYPTPNNYLVYDIAFHLGKVYVATEKGIYQGTEGNPLLPAPGAWTPLTGLNTSQMNVKYTEIESFGSKLFYLRDSDLYGSDSIFYLQNGVLNFNPQFDIFSYTSISNQNDTLLVSRLGGIEALDTGLVGLSNIFQYPFDSYSQVQQGLIYQNKFWLADSKYGLVSAYNSWSAESYNTGGPYRTGAYSMDWAGGKLGTASGYIDGIGGSSYNSNGVNLFKNEVWVNFHKELNSQLNGDSIFDFTSIAINPENTNQVFFSTSSKGSLFEILDGNTIANRYDNTNSTLQKRSTFEDYYALTGVSYDYVGNLWVANSFCAEQLVVKAKDNNWYSYDLGSTGKNVLLYELFVDYYNLKWIGTRGNGIIVYDDNTTLDNTNDDRIKILSTTEGNGGLPSNDVFCMAMDFDEELWIGTSAGLAVIYSPQNIWEGLPGEYDAQSILVERDGFVEILLGETPITDIEVDGANRKWIATQGSGVFLISEDGTEEIHHFTTANSPLLSDIIFDIEIDHLSGEVFIGTELGLVSYRADATYGDFEFSDVYSYPNPVRPEFTGDITILGVAFDSDVRITDVAGNLVYRTTSNGGTVIWNGKTTTGERVKSGVYIVWAGEKNDKGRVVTKILFIN